MTSPTDGRGRATRPRPATSDQRLGYRPGLDGIRGVAVAAVMLFHAGVSWLPGGFLGVDLFFVLSGFLITTLLLEEWGTTGQVRLKTFWARRARRLLPALGLMLAAVAVYGATAAPPVTRSGLRWDGLASLFYVANWRFVLGHQSYFAGFAAPSPLRHMWSLAVEEQWYLVWPPALVGLLHALRRRRADPTRTLDVLLGVLALLTAASVAQMVRLDVVTHGAADSGRSYYGTDTHIQVLLVGALLAVAWLRWPPLRSARRRRRWRAGGLAGSVVCAVLLVAANGADRWLYRGGFLLFAVAGALVVASVVVDRPGGGRLFEAAPLRAVGRISYGLYLWHWPVDVWLNPTRVHLSTAPLLVVRTVVTVAFALLSYHLVEVPIRTQRWVLRRPVRTAAFAGAGLAAALTVLPGIGAAAATRPAVTVPRHFVPPAAHVASAVLPALPPGRPVKVLVVGDSVGLSLTNDVTPAPSLRFANASVEGCGLTFGAAIVGGYPIYDTSQCPESQQRTDWLAGLSTRPDVVIMSYGTWEVFDQEYDGTAYRVGTPAYARLLADQMESDIRFIARYSNARIMLLDVPCYNETSYNLGGSASPRNDPRRVAWVNGIFRAVVAANPGRVTLDRISGWACPGGRFLTSRDGVVLRPDGVHYDPQSAALTWADWLGPRVERLAHLTLQVPPARPVAT